MRNGHQKGDAMALTREEELMLEDYKACLSLLFHEDGRKAHLSGTFFLIQGALFGFYSLMFTHSGVIAIVLAVIGGLFSLFWFLVMARMQAFIDLRYCQLVQLEAKLGVITTIKNEVTLRNTGAVQVMECSYKLSAHQRLFSISKTVESLLPVLVGVVWVFLGLARSLGVF
jgi:hypothetical protein